MAIITDEMKQQAIGLKSGPFTIEIEKGMIRKFAEAVEDDSPRWRDGDKMVAPPGLLHTMMLTGPRPELPFKLPLERILDGGGAWEYFASVRSGDVMTVDTKISDITEGEGSSGPMVFLVRKTTWTNQNGEMAARATNTTILR